jgi:hypothetical protein
VRNLKKFCFYGEGSTETCRSPYPGGFERLLGGTLVAGSHALLPASAEARHVGGSGKRDLAPHAGTRQPRRLRLFRPLADEVYRVDLLSLMQHFEMKVRSCCPAGVAHQCNSLALFYFLADFYQIF